MDHLRTKHHVKQEEEAEEIEKVSTELSYCLDLYQPIKKNPITSTDDHVIYFDAKKHKLLTTNDNVLPRNRNLVTRDFLLEMTKVKNDAVVVTVASSNTVSTELELYCDPWKIKKTLTKSDLNGLSRLLLHSSSVKKHVLPFMCGDDVKQVESCDGLGVCVWDHDTDSMHQLVFKYWSSSKAYILSHKWNKAFVKRRELREGDQIGFFWDHHYSRFIFRVLHRQINN